VFVAAPGAVDNLDGRFCPILYYIGQSYTQEINPIYPLCANLLSHASALRRLPPTTSVRGECGDELVRVLARALNLVTCQMRRWRSLAVQAAAGRGRDFTAEKPGELMGVALPHSCIDNSRTSHSRQTGHSASGSETSRSRALPGRVRAAIT